MISSFLHAAAHSARRGGRGRKHLGGAFSDGYDHFHRLHALFRGVSTQGSGKSNYAL